MKILIKVTKEILEVSKMCGLQYGGGIPSENCAIVLASNPVFPNSNVGLSTLVISKEDTIHLPANAVDFITRFDRLTPSERILMSPISFEIEVPDSYIDQVGIEEVKDILSRSKTLELV